MFDFLTIPVTKVGSMIRLKNWYCFIVSNNFSVLRVSLCSQWRDVFFFTTESTKEPSEIFICKETN